MTTQPAGALRGGIDLGGTKIEAVVFDQNHKVHGSARQLTPTTGAPVDVALAMVAAMRQAAQSAGVDVSDLVGVGVGSPGTVDSDAGMVSGARNLPGWDGSFALGRELEERLGAPVKVANDVQVAVTAEFEMGAGRPYSSLLGVFWGTGVGGALILGGQLWRGRGGAGEIGHMVVHIGGRRCGCGNHGCLEAYAGRSSLEAHARKLIGEGRHSDLPAIMRDKQHTRFTSSVWAHALQHGDALATELIDEAVTALGAAIASAVNLLDVEAVIIGGGLGVRFGEPYVQRILGAMRPHLFPAHAEPDVRLVGLGDLGGALGASLLVY
ncbi:MAG: ROK family protein [Solirubrobacteraceae bacterium]